MQRLLTVFAIAVILALGIAIGLSARSLLDMRQAASDVSGAATGPMLVPTTVAAAQPAAAPPVNTVPRRSAPTTTPVPRDVVVEVTEGQLQTQLNSLLVGQSLGSTPLGEATIQSVTVQLRDRLIRVGGGAKAGFLQAPFLAAGTVVPGPNGRPLVQISQASIGGVELPESARNGLAESLQGRVDEMLTDQSMTIRTIDIADGKMRVVGTAGS